MGNSSSSSNKKYKNQSGQKSLNSIKSPIRPIYPLTVSLSNCEYRNSNSGAKRPKGMCKGLKVASSSSGYSTYVNSGDDYNSCSTYDFGGSSYSGGGSSRNDCGGGSSGGGCGGGD